ncbi:putative L-type lectin-domain containing receptor kinase S.7 [Prunus yedoensis var. nudiflora]|uniref:non-specific serine/threonine protein kinase n=1 Tax=Prunus yedoensis var. nudiflora TaxID=2094558 RepID=A0A314UV67_PRUYE|nr:putative L-type lectin-domain containing receptor kinase S.7 [Prunus yedoensis var. nudiflora]
MGAACNYNYGFIWFRCLVFMEHTVLVHSEDVKLLGSAKFSASSAIQIPDDHDHDPPHGNGNHIDHLRHQAGRALYSSPIRLLDPHTHANSSDHGGSGLTFIIVPDEFTIGRPGPWLGMLNDACQDDYKAIAVEFDTRLNPEFGDPNDNHVGINLGTIVSTKTINASDVGVFLNDGSVHRAWIAYDGSRRWMEIHLGSDGGSNDSPALKPIFSGPLDLSPFLNEYMFVGFSASTGNHTQIHSVLSWNFSSTSQAFLGRLQWKHARVTSLYMAEQTLPLCCRRRSRDQGLPTSPAASQSPSFPWLLNPSATMNFWVAAREAKVLKEIKGISQVRHPNLVPIRGWCEDQKETMVVYEFFPNGSLDKWLFGVGVLPWTRRFKVVKDVAEALSFLHSNQLSHKNLKTTSVFLDISFRAVLGDFGFVLCGAESKRFESAVSQSADVFEFGLFVLEVVGGRQRLEAELGQLEERDLLDFAWTTHEIDEMARVVDRRMGTVINLEQAIRVMQIGLLCTLNVTKGRPCMEQVVEFLCMERPIPELPPSRPLLCSLTTAPAPFALVILVLLSNEATITSLLD